MKNFAFLLILIFASCNKDSSPEGALKEFVDLGIGQKVNRELIQEKLTGKALSTFQEMSEEEFESFSNMQNIQADSFKVITKRCEEENKCTLTYSIGYTTKQDDKAKFVSEVKKIAEVVLVNEKWLISEVNNVKTYHESLEPLNPVQ